MEDFVYTRLLVQDESTLREKFQRLKTKGDVADLLEIEEARLNWHLYRIPEDKRYKKLIIPKRSGGSRIILIPASSLKIIQEKLHHILKIFYNPMPNVHGFVEGKSIITNAKSHLNRRLILNIDIKDFFPSIHFGRVKGLFENKPYNLPEDIATILAQICCHQRVLPQGAPTSPIISNMICRQLDRDLSQFIDDCGSYYTRYVDDITISTFANKFDPDIVILNEENYFQLGAKLLSIIETNGFVINMSKVRLQQYGQRQEVTGLIITGKTINVKRKLVRQIRAMLYAWKKYTINGAALEYQNKYKKKTGNINNIERHFEYVVLGKIKYLGMVRGKDDHLYKLFMRQFDDIKKQRIACYFCSEKISLKDEICGYCTRPQILQKKYRLLEMIGQGGSGQVFKSVEIIPPRRTCVIKKIQLTSASDLRRISQEIKILEQSSFPFMPILYYHFRDHEFVYIIMEFIDGGTLIEIPNNSKTMSLSDAVIFLKDMLSALAQLHSKGIIHRDIKPGNIKKDSSGSYKLLDFGISKQLDTTLTSAKMGTEFYASPEQEQSTPTDARSDLYSLGATVYHLLTGQPPSSARDRVKFESSLAPISSFVADIPESFELLIMALLEINPDQRPSNADEALQLLERIYPTSLD